ncbi:flagellar export protein FliJ [Agaribacterium haliotis]|uniref:flagellar export protein FliJ n=1 Tax=Agaribacterium haliotis TaxID=2013869 RepID=UPI000BB58E8C|nr:flagellar export protein FliJ [Agaribacterium haliotis]
MTDKKARRIELLLQLARRKEDEAAQYLAEQQQFVSESEQKLQALTDYYAEYEQHFKQSRQNSEQLARARSFLAGLHDAEQVQQQTLEKAKAQLERARHTWQRQHHESESIKDYRQRHQQKLNKEEERTLQKLLDEQSLRPKRR